PATIGFRTPLLPFFFHCYRAHRDLPSFPTRRSSDLQRTAASRPGYRCCGLVPLTAVSEHERLTVGLRERRRRSGQHDRRDITRTDRKSTRLNSSHVKISYAVFCLKKKKKNTQASRDT